MADTQSWLNVNDDSWWSLYVPEPSADMANVRSGLRKNERACQYFVKNLPPVCSHWSLSERRCTVEVKPFKSNYPSHYNQGNCDVIGRASRCDYYTPTEYEEGYDEGWVCIAPCSSRTGLIKPLDRASNDYRAESVDIDEIAGYNEVGGIGRCDGHGLGTGETPSDSNTFSKLDKKITKCRYYRPWSMGFGSVKPRPGVTDFIGSSGPTGPKHERITYKEALAQVYNDFERYLPFSFDVYNFRAKYQKCEYWAGDEGGVFTIVDYGSINGYRTYFMECRDPTTGNDIFFSNVGNYCTCTDAACNAYKYSTFDLTGGPSDSAPQLLTTYIWSEDAGSYVCNGAKPECPCYTGKWVSCIDDQMKTGMRISADQILELRFWASFWEDRKEYDDFFQQRPGNNPNDPTTSKIYTFSHWVRGEDMPDGLMKGYEVDLCVPAPAWNREFDPDKYITSTSIDYPKFRVETGTKQPGKPSYPTLIRRLELDNNLKQLDVFYPYMFDDEDAYSDAVICDPQYQGKMYIKRGNSLDGDSIIIVGATIPNTTVYVFNMADSDVKNNMPKIIRDNKNARKIVAEARDSVFSDIESGLKTVKALCSIYAVKTESGEDGVFITDPLPLIYNRANEWVVVAEFDDDTYEWRKRYTYSSWCGGIILQTGFTYEEDGTANQLPTGFWPNATFRGRTIPLGDTDAVGTLMSANSVTVPDLWFGDTAYYDYCKKEVTTTTTVTKWGRIGNSSKVWVEIEDINLNSVLEWEIVDATMSITGTTFCEGQSSVKMDVVYPTEFSEQVNLLPNACILKPKSNKIYGFHKSECTLSITYKYQTITNNTTAGDNETIVFPPGLGSSSVSARSTRYTLSGKESFTVSGVYSDTVSLLALFTDSNGRVVSSFSTKLIANVPTINCSSVEIEYRYSAKALVYLMDPSTGFRTKPFTPVATGDTRTHYERPPCGDHVCNKYDCRGPMWYPFDDCATVEYYNEFGSAASCINMYPGGRNRQDYRFCQVQMAHTWVREASWAAVCDILWKYYYSKVEDPGSIRFAGSAAAVSMVNAELFLENDWDMPPFGNDGRDMVERFMSHDFMSHFDSTASARNEWMPLLIDDDTFYFTCNSLEQNSNSVGTTNCFTPVCQMNFLVCNSISETLDYTNFYRWEEVVDVSHRANCTYPKPVYETPVGYGVSFYYFLNNDTAWLWENFWEDIERDVGSDDESAKIDFVLFEYPEYQYDMYKEQFRYVCDEDVWTITYNAPVIEDGVYKTHPSIRLGDGEQRFFETRYNNVWDSSSSSYVSGYNSDYVTWNDECNGTVDGSGDDDGSGSGTSIYYKTDPNKDAEWDHDENIIFDDEAVDTKAEATALNRRRKTGEDPYSVPVDIYSYFNRGIIVKIKRENLKYLPYSESLLDVEITADVFSEEDVGWYYSPDTDVTLSIVDSEAVSFCPSKILIVGMEGALYDETLETNKIFCRPGITIIGNIIDGTSESLYSSDTVRNDKTDSYLQFEKTIELDITPLKMTEDRLLSMDIELTIPSDRYVYLTDIYVYYPTYVDRTEYIRVYERKYTVSNYNTNSKPNLDGPDRILTYRPDDGVNAAMYQSSVYFPVFSTEFPNEISTRNKMRSIAAGERKEPVRLTEFSVKESIDVSVGTLLNVENDAQREIYEDAIDRESGWDTISFSCIFPPKLESFMNKYGILKPSLGTCSFVSKLSDWNDLSIKDSYDGGFAFWQPQGHYWANSEYVTRERCFIYGPVSTLYNCDFIHADTSLANTVVSPLHALWWARIEYINQVWGRESG